MASDLDTVPVLRAHLMELERTLALMDGLLSAQDLAQEYKNMATVTRPSRLTTVARTQLTRVQGYLREEDDERVPES